MNETVTDMDEVSILTAGHFGECDEKAFRMVHGEHTMDVELMECRENPDAEGPDSKRIPFTLVFRAEEDPTHPMQQVREFHGTIHGLESGPLAGLHICRTLRPVRQPSGIYYQIVFG